MARISAAAGEAPPDNVRARAQPFVPTDFRPPTHLVTEHTVLRALGPEHNAADYAAWTSSVDHIKTTPGYSTDSAWPDAAMSLEQNLRDLEMHARHFAARERFSTPCWTGGTSPG